MQMIVLCMLARSRRMHLASKTKVVTSKNFTIFNPLSTVTVGLLFHLASLDLTENRTKTFTSTSVQ